MFGGRVGLALTVALAGCARSGPRDVAPEPSVDIRPQPGGAGASGSSRAATDAVPPANARRAAVEGGRGEDGDDGGGYVYVARRALGTVALAEARNLEDAQAFAIVDKLANQLDACALAVGKDGRLAPGAARLIVQFGADGLVAGTNLKTSPGSSALANALLCFVSPARQLALGPADADGGVRAIALEATWGIGGAAATDEPADPAVSPQRR
jgi:hypothetical protein